MHLCVGIRAWIQVPVEARRGCQIPRCRSSRQSWTVQHRSSEPNAGAPKSQFFLLTTEPSSQPCLRCSFESAQFYIDLLATPLISGTWSLKSLSETLQPAGLWFGSHNERALLKREVGRGSMACSSSGFSSVSADDKPQGQDFPWYLWE